MKTSTVIKIVISAILVAGLVLFLHKNLPRTAVVQITGTDIKRVDHKADTPKDRPETTDAAPGVRTYDVRYINSVDRDGNVRVFRNEDTGWGWPPYFKFDSADVTAQAQAFAAKESRPYVRVTYYGWRIRLFSMFPNVVGMKAVPPDYSHFPVFNIVFVALLIAAAVYIRFKFSKIIQRIKNIKLIRRSGQETAA